MRKRLIILLDLLIISATVGAAPAWASWGCGARSPGGGIYHNWNYATQDAAIKAAVGLCEKTEHVTCSVIGCDPNVNSRERSRALWPLSGPPTVFCGEPGQPKC